MKQDFDMQLSLLCIAAALILCYVSAKLFEILI